MDVAGQMQGHKPFKMAEKRYRRRSLDPLRLWSDRLEAWMLEQVKIAFTGSSATDAVPAHPNAETTSA